MDFNFTDEQNMLRDSISRLVREKYDFDTRYGVVKSEAGWQPDLWAQFAELGLLMAPFSEADGGLGGGPVDSMLMMEEFGKGLVIEPFLPSVVCAGGFLKHAGSSAQKEEYLTALMGGEAVFAFAWAEPQSRYDAFDVTTTARRDGEGYILDGRKSVVIGAPWASHLIVTTRTSGGQRETSGLSVFIVPNTADGLTRRDYPTVDGRRASEIVFENVRVGADALIGEADAAWPVISQVMDEAVAAICAEGVGAMRRLYEITLDYSRTRKQFGVPIGKFQVLQHRMVDMFIAVEESTSMTYMATLTLDDGPGDRAKAASAAKVKIAQSARLVGQEAVQIHGGIGVTEELAAGHYFKRLSLIEHELGGVDHHMARYDALDLQAAEAA